MGMERTGENNRRCHISLKLCYWDFSAIPQLGLLNGRSGLRWCGLNILFITALTPDDLFVRWLLQGVLTFLVPGYSSHWASLHTSVYCWIGDCPALIQYWNSQHTFPVMSPFYTWTCSIYPKHFQVAFEFLDSLLFHNFHCQLNDKSSWYFSLKWVSPT